MPHILHELSIESTQFSTELEIVLRQSNSCLTISASSTQRGLAWAFASCLSELIGTEVEVHVTETQVSIGECLLPGDVLSELTTFEEAKTNDTLFEKIRRVSKTLIPGESECEEVIVSMIDRND